jgi:hypothetical protein
MCNKTGAKKVNGRQRKPQQRKKRQNKKTNETENEIVRAFPIITQSALLSLLAVTTIRSKPNYVSKSTLALRSSGPPVNSRGKAPLGETRDEYGGSNLP